MRVREIRTLRGADLEKAQRARTRAAAVWLVWLVCWCAGARDKK